MTSQARCGRCARCAGTTRGVTAHRAGRAPARPTRPLPLAVALLDEAYARVAEAVRLADPLDRYAAAHLAALRAAAAVLAARGSPDPRPVRRRRPTSAWVLLPAAAPELAEWAALFASGARRRAAAEAGVPGAATGVQADRLVADVEAFLAVVETTLGLTPRLASVRSRAG